MDKYTLITGASGGLGRAFTRECASRGHNLFLTGTKDEKLNALKEEILKEFPNIKVDYKQCDLSSEKDREVFFNEVMRCGVLVNRLINNAGIDFEGAFLEKSTDKINRVIRINIEATLELSHRFLSVRKKDEKFYLIVVSSLASYFPMPQKAIYASSKRMLNSFFIALHEELKDENVNVTIVCPGGMPTTEEMRNSIKSQGVWGKLSSTDMPIVARGTINRSEKNKTVWIPGAFNRFLRAVGSPFTQTFMAKQINNRWKKTRKEAKKYGNTE